MTATGRTYRGMTPEQRERDRRDRLLAAALKLFGTRGYAATTITDVCGAARVTARSFYDHFTSRDQLLLGLYHELVAAHTSELFSALDAAPDDLAERLRIGVSAAVLAWTSDEPRARVCLLEIVGVGPELERARFAVLNGYVEVITAQVAALDPDRDPDDLRRTAVALVGAVNESIVDWLLTESGARCAPEDLVATLQRLHVAALT